MVHLKSIELTSFTDDLNNYPNNLRFLTNLKKLNFNKRVSIFVGENGTGKSTLLEAIAVNVGSILIGGEDSELDLSDKLANRLKLIWSIKTRKGFYFRANDFNNFITKLRNIKHESRKIINTIKEEGRSNLEIMPHARTLADLERLYGEGLGYRSHGESFLDLFKVRFQRNSLYILDEPEAPLSPMRQLTLISMIKEMVTSNCQFMIATHSPMLMSLPDAEIFSIGDDHIKSVKYDDLEHVNITRDFLNNPGSFIRHL